VGILLLTKRSPHKIANRIAGFLYFSFSLSIVHFVCVRLNLYGRYPAVIGIFFPVTFLFGPLIYLYIYRLIHKREYSLKEYLLHLTPFIVINILMFPIYLQPNAVKLARFSAESINNESPFDLVISLIQIAQLAIYIYYCMKEIGAYRKKLPGTVANMEKIKLTYLYVGFYFFFIIFGFTLVLIVLVFLGLQTGKAYLDWMPILVPMAIYVTGYFTLRQDELADVSFIDEMKEKTGKSTNQSVEYTGQKEMLIEKMGKEKYYLNNALSIQLLADAVGLTLHELSRLINEGFHENFYDFVNRYRVEDAKQMLRDSKYGNLTILAIAEEAGFNSKSAFNAAFKKHTGMTPTEYRKFPLTKVA